MNTYTGNTTRNSEGEDKATLLFIGLAMVFVLGLFVSELSIPLERLLGYSVALAFEAWAILNKRRRDTISEGFWKLANRPLVPWICGFLTTYYFMNGAITHVVEQCALIGIQAHFFWQANHVYREYREREGRTNG